MKKCNKTKFNSSWEAHMRMLNIKLEDINAPLKRNYYCPICDAYHLTSMDDKRFGEIVKRREKIHEDFIKRESKYWNKKFGIEE